MIPTTGSYGLAEAYVKLLSDYQTMAINFTMVTSRLETEKAALQQQLKGKHASVQEKP